MMPESSFKTDEWKWHGACAGTLYLEVVSVSPALAKKLLAAIIGKRMCTMFYLYTINKVAHGAFASYTNTALKATRVCSRLSRPVVCFAMPLTLPFVVTVLASISASISFSHTQCTKRCTLAPRPWACIAVNEHVYDILHCWRVSTLAYPQKTCIAYTRRKVVSAYVRDEGLHHAHR
jgi:hypothetical protein